MNLTVNCNTIDKPLEFNQIQFNNALLSLRKGVGVRPWPIEGETERILYEVILYPVCKQ